MQIRLPLMSTMMRTGQLQTKAALDYETQTDYEVTVIATDTGGLTGTITVTINVTNVLPVAGDTAVANSAPAFEMVRAPPAQWLRTQRQRQNINSDRWPWWQRRMLTVTH